MPSGFFTIEQYTTPEVGAAAEWVPISHHDGGKTLSDVIASMEDTVGQGFYRVIQTQRMIRVEVVDGQTKLRKRHAMDAETLQFSANAHFQADRVKTE